MITDVEMKAMATLNEKCENPVAKQVVDVVHDMLFDLDTTNFNPNYFNKFAKRLDRIMDKAC